MLTFGTTSASNFNIVSMMALMFMQRMGIEHPSLHLRFVTTASIIFENADVNAKCEWAFV